MNWKQSSFLKHYILLTVEGKDPEIFLNQCLRSGIYVRNIKYIHSGKVKIEASAKDISRLEQIAGNRFKLRVSGSRGYWYRVKKVLMNKWLVAGLLVFSGLMYYQSLFVSELAVDGYEKIPEQQLRKTMREAGLYEGCRKTVDVDKVKLHLYDEYESIAWVGISFDGNLAYVTIAEGDYQYSRESSQVAEEKPCNIVAAGEGYIERVIPLEGMQVVKEGAFVKEGDVLISGEISMEDAVYSEEEDAKKVSYVHAAGNATAKIPVRLNLYREAYDYEFKPTGRRFITVAVNGREAGRSVVSFEKSLAEEVTLLDFVKPFPLRIQLILTEEVVVKKTEVTEKELKEYILAELHEYTEENLPEDTQILNKSLNFTREKNIINIGVTLETLQQIGIEEEIIIDNSNGKSEKDDDQ